VRKPFIVAVLALAACAPETSLHWLNVLEVREDVGEDERAAWLEGAREWNEAESKAQEILTLLVGRAYGSFDGNGSPVGG
jgi:hypothetical protein